MDQAKLLIAINNSRENFSSVLLIKLNRTIKIQLHFKVYQSENLLKFLNSIRRENKLNYKNKKD